MHDGTTARMRRAADVTRRAINKASTMFTNLVLIHGGYGATSVQLVGFFVRENETAEHVFVVRSQLEIETRAQRSCEDSSEVMGIYL